MHCDIFQCLYVVCESGGLTAAAVVVVVVIIYTCMSVAHPRRVRGFNPRVFFANMDVCM